MCVIYVCIFACAWGSNQSILIFLCLCLPVLNQLGVQTRLMLGPSEHSPCPSAFICLFSFFHTACPVSILLLFCSVCLSVYLSFFSSSFLLVSHSSSVSALYHALVFFTTSFRFMCGWWMLMNLWISAWGALFRGRAKWFHSLLCGIWARGGTGWELKAPDNCFVLVHSLPQREWPHLKQTIKWPFL